MRRQPDEAGRDPLQHRVGVEREREDHHRDPGERQHLIDEDPAVPLDAQVLGGHDAGDPQRAHRPTLGTGWPGLVPRARVSGDLVDSAGDDVDRPRRQRAGAFELVAGDQHRRPGSRRLAERVVEFVPGGGIEAGVGFVEQPQLGSSGDQAGERGATLLARRQLRHGDIGDPTGHVEAVHRCMHLGVGGADRRTPEPDVLGDGEVAGTARSGGRAARRFGGSTRGAWRDRDPARCRCRAPVAAVRRTAAAASSCLRRSGPRSSTISPSSTRSVAPASAGNRPSTATASSRSTTDMPDTLGREVFVNSGCRDPPPARHR